MRNALAYVTRGQHAMAAAAIRQAFIQPDHGSAVQTWRHVADQLRAKWPKLGAFMDDAEADDLACMALPAQHRTRAQHQPAGAAEQGGEAPRRCGRHLPQRVQQRAPDRSRHPRATDGWRLHTDTRRSRHWPTSTHHKLHHVAGNHPARSENRAPRTHPTARRVHAPRSTGADGRAEPGLKVDIAEQLARSIVVTAHPTASASLRRQ